MSRCWPCVVVFVVLVALVTASVATQLWAQSQPASAAGWFSPSGVATLLAGVTALVGMASLWGGIRTELRSHREDLREIQRQVTTLVPRAEIDQRLKDISHKLDHLLASWEAQ